MTRSVLQSTRSQAAARQATWLCAALLCCIHAASGQAPEPQAAEAEALILQGLKLREQGQDAGALQLFERAYELSPTPRAMAQRALAEQALGAWVQAEEHLRSALAAKDDPWIALHNEALVRSLATVGDHLGTLQVNGGREGAELRIDGQRVGELPLAEPLRVVVGKSLLEVALAGYYPVRREIIVKAGAVSTETIALQPVRAQPVAQAERQRALSAESAGAAADHVEPAGLPVWVFLTGTAVTAALGGVTLWSGLNTIAHNDEYESFATPGADRGMAELGYDRAKSAQDRTNILIGATAAAGVATAVIGLFFTDWDGTTEQAQAARRPPPPAKLYADFAGFGLMLDQRF